MLLMVSLAKASLAVVTLLLTIRAGSANCPLLTLSDLGSNEMFTSMGLVSAVLPDNQPVQIVDFNIVCLSSGMLRDTYSSASVVISYMCAGGTCTGRNPGTVTDQFVFSCNEDVWGGDFSNVITDPIADLTTPLETSCSGCRTVPEISDGVTLCISCPDICDGLGLCLQTGACCNVFLNDVCAPVCYPTQVRGPDNICFFPMFEVNNVTYPLPMGRATLFVFDLDLTPPPLSIVASLEGGAMWDFRDDLAMTDFMSLIQNEPNTLIDGTFAFPDFSDMLQISPAPGGINTYRASTEVHDPIFITVVATGNPYLDVFPPVQIFPPGTTNFSVSFISAYTLDGVNTIAITFSDLMLTVTDMLQDFGEVEFFPVAEPISSSLNQSISFTLEGVTQALVTVGWNQAGFSPSSTVQIIVAGILEVPNFVAITEGDVYVFSCIPTVPTEISFSRGLVAAAAIVTLPGAMEVNVTEGDVYFCSDGQVSRNTLVVVVTADSNVTIFDQTISPVLNEHILNSGDLALGGYFFGCFGRPGHEDLVLTSDLPALQAEFDAVGISSGMPDQYFATDPLTDLAEYMIVYASINGSSSINFVSVTVSIGDSIPNFVRRFQCLSRQSNAFQYVTVTMLNTFIFLPPPTNISISVGESRTIDFYLSRTDDLIVYDVEVAQATQTGTLVEMIARVTGDDPQLVSYSTGVIVPARNGGYSIAATNSEDGADTASTSFQLFVTVPTLLSNETSPVIVNEGETLELTCVPSNPAVPDAQIPVEWFLSNRFSVDGPTTITAEDDMFELSPPDLNHRLVVRNAGTMSAGEYTCEVIQNSQINLVRTVIVRARCDESFAAGVFWPISFEGMTERIRCSLIDPRFNNFINATRTCGARGVWFDVNFTPCTLSTIDTDPFILVWFNFVDAAGMEMALVDELTGVISAELGESASVDPSTASLTVAPQLLTVRGELSLLVQPALYRASLILNSSSSDAVDLNPLVNRLVFSENNFGGVPVFPSMENTGVEAFLPSLECDCRRAPRAPPFPDDSQDEPGGILPRPLARVCGGVASSPCICVDSPFTMNGAGEQSELPPLTPCNCTAPFVGNGDSCVTDTDRDSFPDLNLSTCSNATQAELYCMEDSCPEIYNIPQASNPCVPGQSVTECPREVDEFGILWGYTEAGTTHTQPCGICCTGDATRRCDADGFWMDPIVTGCLGVEFPIALQSSSLPYELEVAESLLLDIVGLVNATTRNGTSIFPSELETAATTLRNVVSYLWQGVEFVDSNGGVLPTIEQSLPLLDLINNLVDSGNEEGTNQLDSNSTFSADVLFSAEGFVLFLSAVLEQENIANGTVEITLVAENILASILSVDIATQTEDIVFPSSSIAPGTGTGPSILDRIEEGSIVIPLIVLQQRSGRRPSGRVRVANFLLQNLEQLLPTNMSDGVTRTPISIILCAEVEDQRSLIPLPDPVNLTFIVDLAQINDSMIDGLNCTFFDFDQSVFSEFGVDILSAVNLTSENATFDDSDSDLVLVNCQTLHLTSFAVLVNVQGADIGSLALDIVSYIGLGISLFCLLLTIIFFLSFGKALFTGVHNFVHLNLAIALFLGYLCFAIGIELAARHTVSCRIVTALLHYLFLAVFCWMLSEGVMLYLMLVVVFSTLSKKWWFFFMLGWLPPIVFVVIGLATSLDDYGFTGDDGDLEFCWFDSDSNVIWAFVAPMIAIMLINVVFLVLVISSLVRSQRRKQKVQDGGGKRRELASSIVKASIILLPLLGLTWVFGLLIINRTAVVFAWIFTIFNTLQGLFIFFFHVVRHEKVWGRIKKKYNLFQTTSNKSSNSQGVYKKAGTVSTGGGYYVKEKADSSTFNQSMVTESTEFMVKDEAKVSSSKYDGDSKTGAGVEETGFVNASKEGVKDDGGEIAKADLAAAGDADSNFSVEEQTVDFTREKFKSVHEARRNTQL